jgi:hypothetical protein
MHRQVELLLYSGRLVTFFIFSKLFTYWCMSKSKENELEIVMLNLLISIMFSWSVLLCFFTIVSFLPASKDVTHFSCHKLVILHCAYHSSLAYCFIPVFKSVSCFCCNTFLNCSYQWNSISSNFLSLYFASLVNSCD